MVSELPVSNASFIGGGIMRSRTVLPNASAFGMRKQTSIGGSRLAGNNGRGSSRMGGSRLGGESRLGANFQKSSRMSARSSVISEANKEQIAKKVH